MKRILFTILFVLMASTLFAQTSPTQSPKNFIERSGKLYRIASLYPGVNVNDASSDQTGMAALLADTSIKNIYFPPGRYTVPSSITNTVSNRTFWFDNGAMIVGVFHVAAGTGVNDIVKNVTVIGNPIVTDRFGMYFCQNIKVDGVTMYDTTAGARGVHIYQGSKDVDIGSIYVYKAQNIYAVGIDNDTAGLAYEPTNIRIGQLTVVDCDSSAVRMANTRNVEIERILVRSFDELDAVLFYNCNDTRVGYVDINGRSNISPVGTGASGLRIELDTNAHVEQAFIDCDTATMSAISIVNSTSYPGVTLGSLYLRSSDTVGSKWGLQLSTTKNVWVSKVRATRFGNAIRLVNATNTTILAMQADSSRIGFNTGGTNDTLTMLTADFVGNTADNGGTSPQSFSNVRGLLTNPNLYKDSLQIRNTGQITVPSNDTLNGNQAIHGIKMTGTTNVGYRGLSLLWQTTLLGTDRPQVAFKQGLYDATGFGLSDLGVYSRTNSSDSILRKMFEWKHNGRTYIVPNGDSSKAWSFPLDRPTDTTRMLTVTTAGVGTFSAIPSGGGGSGDNVKVDTTLASGGEFDPSAPVFKADSGLSLNRVGSTDSIKIFLKTGGILQGHFDTTSFAYIFDTVIAKSMIFTPNVQPRGTATTDTLNLKGNGQNPSVLIGTGTLGKIHIQEDGAIQWIYSGDSLTGQGDSGIITGLRLVNATGGTVKADLVEGDAFRPNTVGSTLRLQTYDSTTMRDLTNDNAFFAFKQRYPDTSEFALGDNSILLFPPGLWEFDSTAMTDLIVDTGATKLHAYDPLPKSVPASGDSLIAVILKVPSGYDTAFFMPFSAFGGGGGTATRLGADSSAAQNSPIAFDDTTVFLDGVGMKVNFERDGDTSTIWYDADTANVLASRQFAQDIAGDSAALRSLSFDTTTGIHTARMPLRWREHPNGTIVFEIGLNAAGDTIKPSVGTGSIGTTFIANNAVTETKIDSTDRHYAVSSFRADTLRSNKTTPSPIYMQDSIRLVGMVIHDTTGGRAYYQGRTIGTLGQVRSYVPVGSAIDSTAWSTVDSNIIQGVSLPADLVAFTSAELAAKLSNETGSGAAVFGTSPTITTPTFSGTVTGTGFDSTNFDNKKLAVTDINLAGRQVEYSVTQWTQAYMNYGGAAIRQDSTWYMTNPYTLGDSVMARYLADTAIQFIWADSNVNDGSDTIVHRGFFDLPEDFTAETLYVTAMSTDTALQIDEIRVKGDSTASSTIKGTPHFLVTHTTDINPTSSITRNAVALAGTSGTTLYRGGRIQVWMAVTTTNATGANAKLKCVAVTIKGRLRN